VTYIRTIISEYKQIIACGLGLALLLFLLKWLQWRFLIIENSLEIYIGLISVFFTLLGVWVAKQLTTPKIKTVVIEKEIYITPPAETFTINEAELKKLNLTSREWDVLQLMATGKSNTEIADSLFLSVSTIKTHASNIFVKMDVKSRTQAMEKAKRLKIIP
jgi:DNA-binding CsgD family transcriptional regulator